MGIVNIGKKKIKRGMLRDREAHAAYDRQFKQQVQQMQERKQEQERKITT